MYSNLTKEDRELMLIETIVCGNRCLESRNDLFLVLINLFPILPNTRIGSYAEDSTMYDSQKEIDERIISIQNSLQIILGSSWTMNYSKAQFGCHLIATRNDNTQIQVGESVIKTIL